MIKDALICCFLFKVRYCSETHFLSLVPSSLLCVTSIISSSPSSARYSQRRSLSCLRSSSKVSCAPWSLAWPRILAVFVYTVTLFKDCLLSILCLIFLVESFCCWITVVWSSVFLNTLQDELRDQSALSGGSIPIGWTVCQDTGKGHTPIYCHTTFP